MIGPRWTVQNRPRPTSRNSAIPRPRRSLSTNASGCLGAADDRGERTSETYQVAATGTTASYTYDANGNLTSDEVRTFAWDGENRLVMVTSGTHESDFSYDGLGRRVRIVEKDSGTITRDAHFIWDGTEIVEERLATGEVNRFSGDWEQLNGSARYVTRDHLGSFRELTDAAGAIVTRNDYDPYRRLTRVAGTDESRFGFGSHYVHASSGLELALYRAYDPSLAQWDWWIRWVYVRSLLIQ